MNNLQLNRNIILDADSYKTGHAALYKYGIQYLESSIIPRKPDEFTNSIVVFGTQYLLKSYFMQQVTTEMIEEAQIEIEEQGLEFITRPLWEIIVKEFNGYLPLKIDAVPEGSVVPVGVPVVKFVNTDPRFAFLPSYIETAAQRLIWYSTTVSSISYDLKKYLTSVMKVHNPNANVDYMLHNFGSRGVGSYESDIISGMAHAVMFSGSDCLQANRNIKHYYNTKSAFVSSVTASEHSASCSNANAAKKDDFAMAEKMIRVLENKVVQYEKTGKGLPLVSVVIDTYDCYRFVREYFGERLKNSIIELAKRGGVLVCRPDSGNPLEVPIEIIKILMDKFGYTVNAQGYKVLNYNLKVLQGDGVNQKSIRAIVERLEKDKISLENIVFGMGGKLVHPEGGRDHFSFAQKATAQYTAEGIWEDLKKEPITDIGKTSLTGRVTTYKCKQSGKIFAERTSLQETNPMIQDMMVTVYEDGVLYNESTFEEIRERANKNI